MTSQSARLFSCGAVVLALAVLSSGQMLAHAPASQPVTPALTAEARDMVLLGYDDLQARSAYQPVIHQQGGRWIAYVGHHGGVGVNRATGEIEPNGTSLVDVTDPSRPIYVRHIPGTTGAAEAGGAQMVRVCDGSELPRANPARTYMLRSLGGQAHEVWDVTDPANPSLVSTPVSGLSNTHKSWWECDTGIAYMPSDGLPDGWRSRITKIMDLSDPANPRLIRNFGLVGQEPGSTVDPIPGSIHGPIRLGNRVYFAYGTSSNGVIQIVDRDRLLNGDPSPTPQNLLYPQVGRLDLAPNWGGHTSFPVLGIQIPDFAKNRDGRSRDFVVVTSEAVQNECQEYRHLTFMVDVTNESTPTPVANFQVAESSGDFCGRGGRFGPHATNESFSPIYYKKMVFVSYFNAGVRALDIRDPYNPKEVAYFIPAITENTDQRCVTVGGAERCKVAIQTNNVEVDDRGYIYIVDRANTGMHILELTGAARQVAGLTP